MTEHHWFISGRTRDNCPNLAIVKSGQKKLWPSAANSAKKVENIIPVIGAGQTTDYVHVHKAGDMDELIKMVQYSSI